MSAADLPLGEILGEVFEDLPQLVVLVAGRPLRIRFANRAARTVLGGLDVLDRTVDDLIDSIPFSAVTPAGELARPELILDRVLREGRQVGPELRRVELPSGTRYLRVLAVPYRPSGTEVGGVVVCGEDVTPQVAFGEARRRFLEGAAHQFRTPLTPIIGYATMLIEGDVPPEEVKEAAREILAAGLRLNGLFERIARLVRLERDVQPKLEETTIKEIFEQVSELDPALLESVDRFGDPETVVRCHPSSLFQVIFELLENGRRFGRPPITVSWERSEGAVAMRISDTGPGPEPGLLSEDLFGPRDHRSGEYVMPKGMGFRLGLAHARALAALSNAKLQFERDDTGWAFVLSLQSASSEADA